MAPNNLHPTTVKLPEKVRQRIARIVAKSDQTIHSFILEAVCTQTDLAERRMQFLAEAQTALAEVKSGGLVYEAADVHKYVQDYAAQKSPSAPKGKHWRK